MILIIKYSGMSIKFDFLGKRPNHAPLFSFPPSARAKGFQVTASWAFTKAAIWDTNMPEIEFLPSQDAWFYGVSHMHIKYLSHKGGLCQGL